MRFVEAQSSTRRRDRKTHGDELVSDHVPNPPALVSEAVPKSGKKVVLDLFWRKLLGDGDESGHGEESNGILVVGGEFAVHGDDVGEEKSVGVDEVLGERLRRRQTKGEFVKAREER